MSADLSPDQITRLAKAATEANLPLSDPLDVDGYSVAVAIAPTVAALVAEARRESVGFVSTQYDRIKAEEWRIFVEASGYEPEDPSEDDYGTCVREAVAQVRAEAAVDLAALRQRIEALTLRISSRYARLCTLRQGNWDDYPEDEVEADVLHGVLTGLRALLDDGEAES